MRRAVPNAQRFILVAQLLRWKAFELPECRPPFSGVKLHAVDFSKSARRRTAPAYEAALRSFYGNQDLMFDPVLGIGWRHTTYDCATKWPRGFHPSRYGLLLTDRTCSNRAAVDFTRLHSSDLGIDGLDLSEAYFRGADFKGYCFASSLRGADFTNARVRFGSTNQCDLSRSIFRNAYLLAPLAGAKLDGTRFIDSTIHAYSLQDSRPKFSVNSRTLPDPTTEPVSELPGASFVRTRIVCEKTKLGMMEEAYRKGDEARMVATFRRLEKRGATIDATCLEAYPSFGGHPPSQPGLDPKRSP